jgi:transposase InsO family protein
MGIEEVLSTPRSPWQRAYIERLIGSIRRECLDQVIVWLANYYLACDSSAQGFRFLLRFSHVTMSYGVEKLPNGVFADHIST